MITKLYNNMEAGLKEIYDYTVYREEKPQDFVKPSFLVSIYEQKPMHGINGRLKNTVSIDVCYFPQEQETAREECWGVGQELFRYFRVQGFKMKNRNLKIEENILHYRFETEYRQFLAEDASRMQNITQNTECKI